jgi:superfamily II DNA or RNA helicase
MTARAPKLHAYQAVVLSRIEDAAASGTRRVLLVAPTGSGKTVIAAAIISNAANGGRRVLFLDHRRELTGQASCKLASFAVDHGIVQAGFPARPGERVQVASIQTLHARAVRSRSMELPPADLVVVDEAHHSRAATYQTLLAAYPDAVILGLTATPCRSDGRGLGNVFEAMIECPSVGDLIAGEFLVGTKVFAPTRPDLTGVHVPRGDYIETELAARMNTAKLVGDIVEHWCRLGERRPTVAFAVDVAHSVHLRNEFRRASVLAEHLDGSTPIEERDRILAQLATGAIEVVTNCMVLTEGWDQPSISCLVLARPTKSLGLYRQMVGRCLRPAPGKTEALILDHSGATFEHGFAEDPIEWTLYEDRRAENSRHKARGTSHAPSLTTCPECSAVRFEGKPCPVCRWRPSPKAKPIEVADGELGWLTRNRRANRNASSQEERLRFQRELTWIARDRSYASGWVGHKYREKFGDWPARRDVDPAPPSMATLSWVRSRQIAYAKSRS